MEVMMRSGLLVAPGALLVLAALAAEHTEFVVNSRRNLDLCSPAVAHGELGGNARYDVARLRGDYAALAGLTLYQLYPCRLGNEGGIFTAPLSTPVLAQPFVVLGPSLSRGNVTLSYTLQGMGASSLRVHDLRGAVVRALAADSRPGAHTVTWDGTDAGGRKVPAGAYFCVLERGGSVAARKVVLVR
jgi:hypothetical protein